MFYNYKLFLSFLMILSFSFLQGQKILFDSLKYKMPIKTAKAYIKTNKKKYQKLIYLYELHQKELHILLEIIPLLKKMENL